MKHLNSMIGRVPLNGALVILLIANSTLAVMGRAGGKKVPADETEARARELGEQAIAGKGGRERLSKIGSLYVAADQGQGFR